MNQPRTRQTPSRATDIQGSSVHVVGLAGVGMNGIAQVLRARGVHVSGSDRLRDQGTAPPLLEALKRQGITVYPQDGSGITSNTVSVVVSSAIEPDNPDVQAAQQAAIPIIHRAEALAAAVGDDRCIAVAGTSGKTTVTGMIGWMLAEAGLDPNVVNGGAVLNWKSADQVGNVRMGSSGLWVIEVDESDRSLLRFHPEWAVITNISRDHFALDETIPLFGDFAAQVTQGVVLGEGVRHLLAPFHSIKAKQCEVIPKTVDSCPTSLPGQHNRQNAHIAMAMCEQWGVPREALVQSLSRFKGIERRLERIGTVNGVTVYDDYAHNPAKIRAAWEAASAQGRRVQGVWRPHGYGPLTAMADELVRMLGEVCRPCDRFYVLPVYYAGGTATPSVTADTFATRLKEAGVPAAYAADYDALELRILQDGQYGDIILCMGARDPYLPVFARKLLHRADAS